MRCASTAKCFLNLERQVLWETVKRVLKMGRITKFLIGRVKDGSAAISAAAASAAYAASSWYTHTRDTAGTVLESLNNGLDWGASQMPSAITDRLINAGYLNADPAGYGVDVPNVSGYGATAFAGIAAGLLGCKLSGDDARKDTEAYKKIDGAIMDEIIQELEGGKDIDSLDETHIYDNVLRKLENEKGSGFWIFKDSNKRARETFSKYKGTVDQEGSCLNTIRELKKNSRKEGYERLNSYLKERALNDKNAKLSEQIRNNGIKYADLLKEYGQKNLHLRSLYSELDNQDAGGFRIKPINPAKDDRNLVTLTGKQSALDESQLFKTLGREKADKSQSIQTRSEALEHYRNEGKGSSNGSIHPASNKPLDKVIKLGDDKKNLSEEVLFGALGRGNKPDIYKKPVSREYLDALVGGNKNEKDPETKKGELSSAANWFSWRGKNLSNRNYVDAVNNAQAVK